jgi:hypothetical protein
MLLADLSDFMQDHRPHGGFTAEAGSPTVNGYRLTVACPCGVTFERCVTASGRLVAPVAGPGSAVAMVFWRSCQM